MDELVLTQNAIYDNPWKYDIQWEDYVEWAKGKKFPWKKLKVRNQNAYKDTVSGCWVYGLTYIYNGNQINEFEDKWIEFEQEDPRWKWYTFQAERWNPWNVWSSLQECMSFFKKRWLIDWYVKCNTIEECKNALNNWCWIYTWTTKCNWKQAKANKEFAYDPNWAAHCIAIVDYDDTGFISINSFGEYWWDKWYFHINYDMFDNLFSKYAIVDHDDSGKLDELVFNAQFQKAIELGITNWTRPDDPATRKEVAVMIYRALKLNK